MAPSSRSRRSTEYCFIQRSLAGNQLIRNPLYQDNFWREDDHHIWLTRNHYDASTARLRQVISRLDKYDNYQRQDHWYEMRLYSPHEIDELLATAGLAVVERYGPVSRSGPTRFHFSRSPGFITLARKPHGDPGG